MEPTDNQQVDATDGAKELASQYDVDLSQLVGSGENGRVQKNDVDKYLEDQGITGGEFPIKPHPYLEAARVYVGGQMYGSGPNAKEVATKADLDALPKHPPVPGYPDGFPYVVPVTDVQSGGEA